eukprot:52325-Chlamydomonas_euryale.AAC.2
MERGIDEGWRGESTRDGERGMLVCVGSTMREGREGARDAWGGNAVLGSQGQCFVRMPQLSSLCLDRSPAGAVRACVVAATSPKLLRLDLNLNHLPCNPSYP